MSAFVFHAGLSNRAGTVLWDTGVCLDNLEILLQLDKPIYVGRLSYRSIAIKTNISKN